MRCLAHGTSALHEDRQENKQGLRPECRRGEHIAQNRTKLECKRKYCLNQPIERSSGWNFPQECPHE